MKKYDSYKDSGIEWIGEIPGHWMVKKIKHRCYVKARVGWKGLKSDEFLSDGFAYLVTGSDFKNDKVAWKECYHIDKDRYDEDPYIQLQEEDLLITKDGTIGKLAIVNNLDKPACLNSGIFVVRSIQDDFSTGYLFWILKSKLFTQFNEYTSYGSTIQHLYQNVFVEFVFTFPSKEEQIAIANYLDHKTAEIDELIADKKRLLELYEEEKTVIINQAVTKGINPDVPMKDSGIEWLGEIPEHWEVLPLKRITTKITDGEHISPNFTTDGMPFLSAKDVRDGYVQLPDDKFVKMEDGLKFRKRCNPEIFDVLMVSRGATVGRVSIVDFETPFCLLGSVILFKTNMKVIGQYLLYSLKNKLLQENLLMSSQSSAQQAIYLINIADVRIGVPLEKEQQAIVHHIETECARIDAKKSRTEKLIELLTEYRTALISEVVTGKIKVVD